MSESFRSRFFGGMKAYEEFEMCFDVLSPSVYESRVILFDSLKIKLFVPNKKEQGKLADERCSFKCVPLVK